MLPEDESYARYSSLTGLYQRLREDAALNLDTMDQRYGAWAQLIVLFRLIHDGARANRTMFDPGRFRFLEGRRVVGVRQTHERVLPPHVSDGVVYRALEKLLVLDGDQIGSVYETLMGFVWRPPPAARSPSSPRRSWARRTRSTSTRCWPSRTAAAEDGSRSVLTAPSRTRSRRAPRRADGGRPGPRSGQRRDARRGPARRTDAADATPVHHRTTSRPAQRL